MRIIIVVAAIFLYSVIALSADRAREVKGETHYLATNGMESRYFLSAVPQAPEAMLIIGGLRALERAGAAHAAELIVLEEDIQIIRFHKFLQKNKGLPRRELIELLFEISITGPLREKFEKGTQGESEVLNILLKDRKSTRLNSSH